VSAYSVRVLDNAKKDLGRIDKATSARIVKRIIWLATSFDEVRPLPLKHGLAGLFKLRVGDYRVIYRVDRDTRTLVILAAGHRREVYDV